MKHLLLSFSVLICSAVVYAQPTKHAYYDALELRKYIITDAASGQLIFDPAKKSEYDMILAKYLNPDPALDQDVTIIYTSNPFIKKYVPLKGSLRGDSLAGLFHNGGNQGPIRARSLGSAIGAMDVTSLADGLAQFLIERGNEELNAAFFNRFKRFLDQYPEFKTLFPNTKLFIDNLNAWEYANALNTLREAFDKDMKELLVNITKLKDLDPSMCRCKAAKAIDNDRKNADKDKDICPNACARRVNMLKGIFKTNEGRYLLSALVIANGILNKEKYPDIINTISGEEYLAGIEIDDPQMEENFKNGLQLVNTISLSLKSNRIGMHYITSAEIDTLLINDAVLRDLFLGLLYQEIKTKKIKINSHYVHEYMEVYVQGTIAYITDITTQIKNLNSSLENIKQSKVKGEKDQSAYYAGVFESAKDILSAMGNTETIHQELQLPEEYQKIIDLSGNTFQIAHDIAVQNYNAAILGTVKLITDVAATTADTTKETVKNFTIQLVKYGSFAANVVNAESPEEVKDAIKAVALPSGSFIVKQQLSWNVAVNGYIGYCWDWTSIDGKKFINGVYAPVGISVSKGFSRKALGAVTLFASLLDVGGIATYRLSNGQTDTLKQQVRLESIFSPSAQLMLSIPRAPISVCAGWRYTPKLYYTNGVGFETYAPRSTINLAVLIDIPIFNIYSKSFKIPNAAKPGITPKK